MNVLVMSDYGISDTSTLKDVDLEDFLDEDDYQYVIYTTGYAKVTPYALMHSKILSASEDIEGIDIYLTSQVQDPPMWWADRVPEPLRYAEGKFAQDILIVARPAYQLVASGTSGKIISVNGCGNDTLLKGGSGRNPYLEDVVVPLVPKGKEPKRGSKEDIELQATRQAKQDYDQFKYDMHTQAFMMGPGKLII